MNLDIDSGMMLITAVMVKTLVTIFKNYYTKRHIAVTSTQNTLPVTTQSLLSNSVQWYLHRFFPWRTPWLLKYFPPVLLVKDSHLSTSPPGTASLWHLNLGGTKPDLNHSICAASPLLCIEIYAFNYSSYLMEVESVNGII